MKRIRIFISAILIMSALTGCTAQKENNDSQPNNTETTETTETANTETTETATDKSDNSISKDTDNNTKKDNSTEKNLKDVNTNNKDTQKVWNSSNKEKSSDNSKDKASNSQNKISIDEKYVDKNSTFYFGMSYDDAKAKLDQLQINIISEIEITSKESDPEFGNKEFVTDYLFLAFDKSNNQLSDITARNFPTSLGLKNGDTLDKMEKLYGNNYTKHETYNRVIYEYSLNGHYFTVNFSDNKVITWSVTKYKFLQ